MPRDEAGEALERLDAAGIPLAEMSNRQPDAAITGRGRRVQDRRWVVGQMKKRRFVELFAVKWAAQEPDALNKTIAEVGWKGRSMYIKARQRDPKFAAAVDAIRGGRNGRPSKAKQREAAKQLAVRRMHLEVEKEWAPPPDEPKLVLPLPDPEKGELGWHGFAGFRKAFFGMDTPWFQQMVVDALEKSEPGSITLILLPPEHGKTSLLEDWIGFKLATDPTFRVVYASEKQSHTRKVAKRIKGRMHPDGPCRPYVQRFGPFIPQVGDDAHPQPFAADFFDVWRRMGGDERDYNFVGLGISSAVAGTRCDLLVIDDPQSLKSLNLTPQIVEQFRQDWLSRPGPHGRTVILMTRVGERDFAEAIMDAGLVDHLVRLPAIDPTNGRHLWPERYSPEDYERMKRNAGESAWARNYLQQPTAAGERTFNQDMLDACADRLLRVGQKPEHLQVRSAIVTHDPGFGRNAVFVWGVMAERCVALDWRVDVGLTSTAQMAQVLDDVMDHWTRQGVRVSHLVIEDKYVGQGLMADEAFIDLTRRYGCSLSGHKTGSNKLDDDIGVAGMARSFRQLDIVLPGADDEETQRKRAELDAEFCAWRPVRGSKLRMDIVMAAWFGWHRWRTERLNTSTDDRTNLIRTSGMGGLKPFRFVPAVKPSGPLVGLG